ncbi:g5319 [Coccomyxa elongata]
MAGLTVLGFDEKYLRVPSSIFNYDKTACEDFTYLTQQYECTDIQSNNTEIQVKHCTPDTGHGIGVFVFQRVPIQADSERTYTGKFSFAHHPHVLDAAKMPLVHLDLELAGAEAPAGTNAGCAWDRHCPPWACLREVDHPRPCWAGAQCIMHCNTRDAHREWQPHVREHNSSQAGKHMAKRGKAAFSALLMQEVDFMRLISNYKGELSWDAGKCTDIIANFGQWLAPSELERADSVHAYVSMLRPIIAHLLKLRESDIRVHWVTTNSFPLWRGTWWNPNRQDWRTDPILLVYNRTANTMMEDAKIPIIDTYSIAAPLFDLSYDGAHYKGHAGYNTDLRILNMICQPQGRDVPTYAS